MRKTIIMLLTIISSVGSLTVVNRIEPYVFGLPFIVFWATLWLILTGICLYVCSVLYDKEEEYE